MRCHFQCDRDERVACELPMAGENITFQQLLDESADKEKMYYI